MEGQKDVKDANASSREMIVKNVQPGGASSTPVIFHPQQQPHPQAQPYPQPYQQDPYNGQAHSQQPPMGGYQQPAFNGAATQSSSHVQCLGQTTPVEVQCEHCQKKTTTKTNCKCGTKVFVMALLICLPVL